LWSEDEEFDFEGKHFQIKKGYLAPKPLQKPFPAVMNAGNSETGRHYAAKYCDIAFVNINRNDLEVSKSLIANYRKLAREEYGRELKIWGHGYVVQGETEREARDTSIAKAIGWRLPTWSTPWASTRHAIRNG
jgi:FMNH2-dependent dimethyl sulfone monooxygenase